MNVCLNNISKSLKKKIEEHELIYVYDYLEFKMDSAPEIVEFHGTSQVKYFAAEIQKNLLELHLKQVLKPITEDSISYSSILEAYVYAYAGYIDGNYTFKQFEEFTAIFEAAISRCKNFVVYNVEDSLMKDFYKKIAQDYYLSIHFISGTDEECLEHLLRFTGAIPAF